MLPCCPSPEAELNVDLLSLRWAAAFVMDSCKRLCQEEVLLVILAWGFRRELEYHVKGLGVIISGQLTKPKLKLLTWCCMYFRAR